LFLGEAGDFLEAYHIKVSSPDPHAVGINVETELGQFSAHRQRFSNTTTDAQGNESTAYHTTNIGTRIEGTYAFVVPTLYFRREKPAFVNKWGGGLGLGFIQIDGTARMAPGLEERQADATPTPIHSGQVPGFSALVFVEVTPFFDPAAGLGFLKALRARLELGLVSTFGSRTDYSIDVARLTVSYVFGGS
jgi:hypothetical protein